MDLDDLEKLRPAIPYVALVVIVYVGGLVAKPIWKALASSSRRGLAPLGLAGSATMRAHPAIVGGLVGPFLLPGTLVERVAWGVVLGEFAESIYSEGKAWLERRRARRASRPPAAPTT